MAFNYQAQPLQILSPGQMNPFNEAVNSGLQKFQQGMQASYFPSQLKEELLKQQIENKYAPLQKTAQAASQLTYSNLMGPQFLAKMMGNPDILANLPDDKKAEALNILYQAGSGKGAGMPNIPGMGMSAESMVDVARNSSGLSVLNQQQAPQQQTQYQQIGAEQRKPSFSENVGEYQGVVAQGKEAGQLRAKASAELSDINYAANKKQETLDELTNTMSSPVFEQIRQVPLAGQHELGYYAKFGTKEQQQTIGKFLEQTNQVISDSAGEFKGAFRVGEQGLLNKMKVNPSDTIDVARGKLEAMSYMNRMLALRTSKAADYMNEGHFSKSKAIELADKNINGEEIRQEIHNKLNPKPSDDDITYMASKYGISANEVRKRLKERGIQ